MGKKHKLERAGVNYARRVCKNSLDKVKWAATMEAVDIL